jgi:hypothetical protein
VWYSELHKRIVKQHSAFGSRGFARDLQHLGAFRFDSTVDLSAIRYANR